MSTTEVLLPGNLVDRKKGPRRFRRYTITLSALVWPHSIGDDPAVNDKDLSRAVRACVTNLSLTGLFFLSTQFFALGTRLWVRVRIGERSLLMPALVKRSAEVTLEGVCYCGCGVQFLRSPETVDAINFLSAYLAR